ncbi:MAG: hypothetical protein HY674_04190 [Chloroflexi bacterium]|nr:hypothetical protein [Chloroflexota bacterium]
MAKNISVPVLLFRLDWMINERFRAVAVVLPGGHRMFRFNCWAAGKKLDRFGAKEKRFFSARLPQDRLVDKVVAQVSLMTPPQAGELLLCLPAGRQVAVLPACGRRGFNHALGLRTRCRLEIGDTAG